MADVCRVGVVAREKEGLGPRAHRLRLAVATRRGTNGRDPHPRVGVPFPILTSFVLVGASAVLNLGLLWRYPVSAQWSERSAPRSWLATLSGLRASLSHWRRRQPVCHPVSRCVPIARPGARLRDGVGSLESAIAMVRPREPPADRCCRTVERTRRQRGFCDPLSLPGSGRGVRPSARLRRSNCHSPAHSTCRNAKRRVQ